MRRREQVATKKTCAPMWISPVVVERWKPGTTRTEFVTAAFFRT